MKDEKQKSSIVKTQRLILKPMEDEEIRKLIDGTSDPELKKAYNEMLVSCMKDGASRVWYAPWKILLSKTEVHVGEIGFKGPPVHHSVEVGYGIDPPYQGNGYATEACKGLIEWAFRQQGVLFIEAEVANDNVASLRILEKLGFKPNGTGTEGLRFIKEKHRTS